MEEIRNTSYNTVVLCSGVTQQLPPPSKLKNGLLKYISGKT